VKSILPTTPPVKIYHVVNPKTFSQRQFEIQQGGLTVLWVNTKSKLFHQPIINIHVESANGPIVAACKLESWSRKLRYYLGNPDCTDKDSWPIADCAGWTDKAYSFTVAGRSLQWKRTHNKDLGAKRFGNKSFKLVDAADGRVLAVHIFTQSLFGKLHQIATIEWFEDLGQEAELASLAVVHGIEERIRQSERSSSSGGGGG